MNSVVGLLKRNSFFSTLFESMPLGVMLVDAEERVLAVNDFLRQIYNLPDALLLDEKIGDLLRCVDSGGAARQCGEEKRCHHCALMSVAREVLKGSNVLRRQASLHLHVGDRTVLITAAPIDYDSERYAILLLEDISELLSLRHQLDRQTKESGIVGQHPSIVDLKKQIESLSDVDVPVLIQGESGVGKELVAKAIHVNGKGELKPFIAVNCGALPDTLLESELVYRCRPGSQGTIRAG
jgi:transcriptional regulator with PAS, ATPase and Fis domain